MTTEGQGRVSCTGGASGIGAACVDLLRGPRRHRRGGGPRAGEASRRATSPTRPPSTRSVAGIVAEHGRLDLAANVAGTSGVCGEVADSTTDDWRHTMAVNLDGVYFCLRAELRAMRAAGRRLDRQRGVVGRADGRARAGRLLGVEARRHRAHQVGRPGGGPPGHPRERRAARAASAPRCCARFAGGDEEPSRRWAAGRRWAGSGEPSEIAEAVVWLLRATPPASSPAPAWRPTAASPPYSHGRT